ncbi:1-acyl-sn-glycerol-3-phosphate acyltransferase [Carnimonas sp. R-84981]|uniref:lysophospholipid acyltransferase family protein n=1 Tax=Carnimonas bestiolae TaxID=3402172 RepID=UPI003EDC400E
MNKLRSIVFYIGYVVLIILMAVLIVPVCCVLPVKKRFDLLNVYNHAIMLWLRVSCGIRIEVHGDRQALPDGACVMLSNHQSEWETLYLQLLKPPICTVLKRELLNIPIFGWSLRLIRPIPLDRSQPSKALKSLMTEGAERLKNGFSVLLFPEGTRVPPGQRKSFSKSGVMLAQRAGAEIVPIAHNSGECWLSGSWVKKPGTIRIAIGQPIATAGRKANDVHAEVEQWIEDRLAQISDVPRPAQNADDDA